MILLALRSYSKRSSTRTMSHETKTVIDLTSDGEDGPQNTSIENSFVSLTHNTSIYNDRSGNMDQDPKRSKRMRRRKRRKQAGYASGVVTLDNDALTIVIDDSDDDGEEEKQKQNNGKPKAAAMDMRKPPPGTSVSLPATQRVDGYISFSSSNNSVGSGFAATSSSSSLPTVPAVAAAAAASTNESFHESSQADNAYDQDFFLAMKLQADLNGEDGRKPAAAESPSNNRDHASELLARKMQAEYEAYLATNDSNDCICLDEDDRKPAARDIPPIRSPTDLDEQLARQLQEKLDEEAKAETQKRKSECKEAMTTTTTGKAFLLVESIIKLVGDFVAELPDQLKNQFDVIAKDDLFFLAEKFIDQQKAFQQAGVPCHVSLGFHYTSKKNVDSIRTTGLLSKPERETSNVDAGRYNGSALGEGIYTADDSVSSMTYGDTGLLVARLSGVESNRPYQQGQGDDNSVHSVRGNGGSWLVLKSASQCLAILQFAQTFGPFLCKDFGACIEGHEQLDIHELFVRVARLMEDTFRAGNPLPLLKSPNRTTENMIKMYCNSLLSSGRFPLPSFTSNRRVSTSTSSASWNTPILKYVPRYPTNGGPAPTASSNVPSWIMAPTLTHGIGTSTGAGTGFGSNNTVAGGNILPSIPGLPSVPNFNQGATNPPTNPYGGGISFASSVPNRFIAPHASNTTALSIPNPASSPTVSRGRIRTSSTAAGRFTGINAPSTSPGFQNLSIANPSSQSIAIPPVQGLQIRQRISVPTIPSAPRSMSRKRSSTSPSSSRKSRVRTSSTSAGRFKGPHYNHVYTSPDSLVTKDESCYTNFPSVTRDECAICLEDGVSNAVKLKVCGHIFCKPCIDLALKSLKTCPSCRLPVMEPQGPMPSGVMHIVNTTEIDPNAHISIRYELKGTKQKSYHPHPGKRHRSKNLTAYLPPTDEGRAVLKRLEYAFMHGLTFYVSNNNMVEASISHKTSATGTHGFPDPNYIQKVNTQLDNAGVP